MPVSRARLVSLVLTWLCRHLPLVQGDALAQLLNRRPKQEPVCLHDQRLQRAVPDPSVLSGVHGVHCLGDVAENSAEETGKPGGPYFSVENGFLWDFKSPAPMTTLSGEYTPFYPQYTTAMKPTEGKSPDRSAQMGLCRRQQNGVSSRSALCRDSCSLVWLVFVLLNIVSVLNFN